MKKLLYLAVSIFLLSCTEDQMPENYVFGTARALELCSFNADNELNLDANNGTTLDAGTVIGKTPSIVATIGAQDTYKIPSSSLSTFTIGDGVVSGGIQGQTNPKDADGDMPSNTLSQPVSGAFLQFEAKADGFLYIFHKASSNKAYTVFENGKAISHTFAAIGDAATDLGAVYQYTLPYEIENGQKVVQRPIEWAEREYLKSAKPDVYASRLTTDADGTEIWNGDDLKKSGSGVIKFPVYSGRKYIVNANGSKITTIGFAFSTDDNLTIKDGDVVIYRAGSM